MKFFRIVLLLPLALDSLQGLTLPQNRADKALNTTLVTGFSGVYERRNPSNNEKIESSSYAATHEYYHHVGEDSWSDYTQKYSALISNFLRSISNLIRCNLKQNGTFTYHVNTNISQKQGDCKDQKCSLPTLIIEATNCEDPRVKNHEEKGVYSVVENQNDCRNLEKAFGELCAMSLGNLASSGSVTKEVRDTPERLLTVSQSTQVIEPGNSFPLRQTNTRSLIQGQGQERETPQLLNEYATEPPSATSANSRKAFMSQTDTIVDAEELDSSSGDQSRDSGLQMKPAGPFNTVPDLSSSGSRPAMPMNVIRKQGLDFTPTLTQQPFNSIYTRAPQSPQNYNSPFFLPAAPPTNTVEKSETVEIVEYDTEKPDGLNVGNIPQKLSFNRGFNPTRESPQPAESPDYLEKRHDISVPKNPASVAGLNDYVSTANLFSENRVANVPPTEQQPQTPQQPGTFPNRFLTSQAPNLSPRPPTQNFLQTTPQPYERLGHPASAVIPSFSQRQGDSASAGQTGSYPKDRYFTTFPPKGADFSHEGQNVEISKGFPVDEVSRPGAGTPPGAFEQVEPLTNSEANKAARNDYNQDQNLPLAPRALNSYRLTTPPIQPPESLIESNQKGKFEITTQTPFPPIPGSNVEETVSQSVFSDLTDRTQTTLDDDENFSEASVYNEMGSGAPMESPHSGEGNAPPPDYLPSISQPSPNIQGEPKIESLSFESDRQATNQPVNSENRPPVTEPTTVTAPQIPITNPQRKVASFAGESSLDQADFYPPQTPNYGYSGPPQEDRFASESSLASDSADYDLPDSFPMSSLPPFSSPLPYTDYDMPLEDLPMTANNPAFLSNEPPRQFSSAPLSGPVSETSTTVHDSDAISNRQTSTPPTTVTPRPDEPNIPLEEFNSDLQDKSISENDFKVSINPNEFPDYGTDNKGNSGSFPADYPFTPDFESQTETELDDGNLERATSSDQFPADIFPTFSPQNTFSETVVETTDEISSSTDSVNQQTPSDQTAPALARFPQLSGPPTKTPGPQPDRNQFQSQTPERSGEIISSITQQISPATIPVSASQIAGNANPRGPSLNVNPQPENAASLDDYYQQNSAETMPEQPGHVDAVPSQEARSRAPQPQPSLEYPNHSGQLSNNERESNTASDLQTSTTFEGSEENFQPTETYAPLPSVLPEPQTFTTETYESVEVADEPRPRTSSPLVGPPSLHDAGALDNSEVSDDFRFTQTTPPLPLTVEEPRFVQTNPQNHGTSPVPRTFAQDVATTRRPQSESSVKYVEEVVITDDEPTPSPSVTMAYPSGLFDEQNEQGPLDRSPAIPQQSQDNLERADAGALASQPVLMNPIQGSRNDVLMQSSDQKQNIGPSTAGPGQANPAASPGQFQNDAFNKDADQQPNAESFAPTSSTASPVHITTVVEEEEISTDSPKSVPQGPPVGYSQRIPNGQFGGQRPYFQDSPQPSRPFYFENRPAPYPPQMFPQQMFPPQRFPVQRFPPQMAPPQNQFQNRNYANDSRIPRPGFNQFDSFAREQFRNDQFKPQYPVNLFPQGPNAQRDQFMPQDQPLNFGNGYSPLEEPRFSNIPPPRPDVVPNTQPFPFQGFPDFRSFQPGNPFDGRNAQGQQGRNFNGQLTAPRDAQNYGPRPYNQRGGFNERFGNNQQSFRPELQNRMPLGQAPVMPPSREQPRPASRPFLNNFNQQVENRYQYPFTPAGVPTNGPNRQDQQTGPAQSPVEVSADSKEALAGLPPRQRPLNFDQEVITLIPESAENLAQPQDAAFPSPQNQIREEVLPVSELSSTVVSGRVTDDAFSGPPQQGSPVPRTPNSRANFFPPDSSPPAQNQPFSQPGDAFGPQRPPSSPNFSNQLRDSPPDFQRQSNANFVNRQNPFVGDGVRPNPSQSDSYALRPDLIAPSREPDPASRRFRPADRPIPGPETFSTG